MMGLECPARESGLPSEGFGAATDGFSGGEAGRGGMAWEAMEV